MLITTALKAEIEYIIANIGRQYQYTQGLILTEDDLKCLIYSRLISFFNRRVNPLIHGDTSARIATNEFRWRMKTQDRHIYASPVHTEIPWYDDRDRLAIRPDITILEPKNLSILHGLDEPRLPSKQCEFDGQGIILELKFIRNRAGLGRDDVKEILKDFKKITRLCNRLARQGKSEDLFCYLVIFNKTDIVCNEFLQFMQDNGVGPHHKVIYATGKVTFEG